MGTHLSLDADQAQELLRGAGLDLPTATVAELAERTEGWPAGLYLAVLAIRAEEGPREAITFAGDDRSCRTPRPWSGGKFSSATSSSPMRPWPGQSRAGNARGDPGGVRGARPSARSSRWVDLNGDRPRLSPIAPMPSMDSAQLHGYTPSALAFSVRARVALHRGDVASARRDVMRTQRLRPILTGAIPWLAVQVRLELARVLLALSDLAGARTVLTEAREILTPLPDLGNLADEMTEMARRLDRLRSGATPGPYSLTTAELRMLAYLPTHFSFREVADRVFLSPKTVKTHAVSIYRKPGVSSRTEAVVRAREIGLLEA